MPAAILSRREFARASAGMLIGAVQRTDAFSDLDRLIRTLMADAGVDRCVDERDMFRRVAQAIGAEPDARDLAIAESDGRLHTFNIQ